MSKILVFDIGGVVIFHDNARLLKLLISRMSRPPCEAELLAMIRQSGIGTGVSTLEQLQASLVRDFGWEGAYAEFLSDWSSHFSPNTLMLETMHSIGAAYPIVLCSNTNREHWSTLCDQYDIQSICQNVVLSFEVGVEKPDKQIYQRVKNLYPGISGEAFFFVDDDGENVRSGKDFGFSTHHYTDHSAFLTDLRSWSVS
ncbi:HAD family hydrolase [Paraburkholderia caribensis]|uniref:HAD family hydrolase n=1 Tax=Paraburkholderia caribensis TaxID=75105 RepID=A0ABV0EC86_9BURK|nr:HAD family hydrolase [Paraburkholderia caribensis]MCO4882711.1 HAD hydrolase-like protein [Paraburkholderia caribensis]PTB23823.1 hypothetical protein C9I56_37170 [Paraburkholderia caribensis]